MNKNAIRDKIQKENTQNDTESPQTKQSKTEVSFVLTGYSSAEALVEVT